MRGVTAILLAAGLSRRMGSINKLLVDVNVNCDVNGDSDGEAMVRRCARALCDSSVDRVVVVVGHEGDAVRTALEGVDVDVHFNPEYESGQMSSMRVGLQNVSDQNIGTMVCLADQPLLTSTDYNLLIDQFLAHPDKILVPMFDGGRANPIVIPTTLRSRILDGGVNFGCRNLIHKNPDLVRTFEVTAPAYKQDFDTPEAFIQQMGEVNPVKLEG